MGKGKFLVIEGSDGVGKGTQVKVLVTKLENLGKKVKVISFPQYGEKSAGVIEEFLNGKYGSASEVGPYRASLFFAIDRYAASTKINNWLSEGYYVIADRYTSSNLAHQASSISKLKEREKCINWIYDLEFNILKIPQPNIVIVLHLDPKIAQQRVDMKSPRKYLNGKKRDINEDNIEHLKKAANGYLYVAKKYNWPVINASGLVNEVHELIWQELIKAKYI